MSYFQVITTMLTTVTDDPSLWLSRERQISEVNLSAFVCRWFHEDLSSIFRTNTKKYTNWVKTKNTIWYLFLDICLANEHKSKGQLFVKLHCKWPVCGISDLWVLPIDCCCFVVIACCSWHFPTTKCIQD